MTKTLSSDISSISLWFHRLLGKAEQGRMRNSIPHYPQVFIVGPPRSGTTLLYQLMVHAFHCAYFPNLANMFHLFPCAAAGIGRRFLKDYKSDYESQFGYSRGLMAPHEGGKIWNRWFPRDEVEGFNYADERFISQDSCSEVRGVISGMEKVFYAPFINKNVKHSVRIRALAQILPGCVFLQVTRNPQHVIASILSARKKHLKTLNSWWSVMPKEINLIRGKPYLEQIGGQVYYLEQDIERDISFIGRERRFVVDYMDICNSPRTTLDRVASFLDRNGLPLEKRNAVPSAFPVSVNYRNISTREREEIRSTVNRFYDARERNIAGV